MPPAAATPRASKEESSPQRSRTRVETVDLAKGHIHEPLGYKEVQPEDQLRETSTVLTEDQVNMCACVLLSQFLKHETDANVWPTTFTYLEMLRAGIVEDSEKAQLQEWMRRRPSLTVYVITSVTRDGSRDAGAGGHHVCIVIKMKSAAASPPIAESGEEGERTDGSLPRPTEDGMRIYDSGHSAERRFRNMRDVALEALEILHSLRAGDADDAAGVPEPPVELVKVPQSERQRGAMCGFHIAIFVAIDVAAGRSDAAQLARLRHCPDDVQFIRRWLVRQAGSGAFDKSRGTWRPRRGRGDGAGKGAEKDGGGVKVEENDDGAALRELQTWAQRRGRWPAMGCFRLF